MNQSNIKILLALAAIAIIGGTYMYVFKPNMEEKDALQAQVNNLEDRRDELNEQYKHKDEYLKEIDQNNVAFDEVVAYYPATLDQEITVMFMKGIEKDKGNLQFDVQSVGLGQEEVFYTLGTAAPADGTNAAVATDDAASNGGYICSRASFPVTYEGSYEGLKDLIDYVMNYKYRMNISSFSIDYDSSKDIYSGNVVINAFCVSGEGRTADTISVNVDNGVYNPFLGGDDAAVNTSSSYDSDDGASIASEHDILIALNNANNDSTDGIILSAGGSDTYVTSADNSVVDVTITVEEVDGKNMVSYAIGSDAYTMELANDELTVYVESSDRVDTDDTNGVNLNIKNSTDIAVYVKVSGDDTTSPRFAIGSKTGVVKVY